MEDKCLEFRDTTLAHPAGIFFAEYYSFEPLFSWVLPGGPLINSQNHREVSNPILGIEADFEIQSKVFISQK